MGPAVFYLTTDWSVAPLHGNEPRRSIETNSTLTVMRQRTIQFELAD